MRKPILVAAACLQFAMLSAVHGGWDGAAVELAQKIFEGHEPNFLEEKMRGLPASLPPYCKMIIQGMIYKMSGGADYSRAVYLLNEAVALAAADAERPIDGVNWHMLGLRSLVETYADMRDLPRQRDAIAEYRKHGYDKAEQSQRQLLRSNAFQPEIDEMDLERGFRAGEFEAVEAGLNARIREAPGKGKKWVRFQRRLFLYECFLGRKTPAELSSRFDELSDPRDKNYSGYDRAVMAYIHTRTTGILMGNLAIGINTLKEIIPYENDRMHPRERMARMQTSMARWDDAKESLMAAGLWYKNSIPSVRDELIKESNLTRAQFLYASGYAAEAQSVCEKLLLNPIRSGFRVEDSRQAEVDLLLTRLAVLNASHILRESIAGLGGSSPDPTLSFFRAIERSSEARKHRTHLMNLISALSIDPFVSHLSLFQAIPIPYWMWPDLVRELGPETARLMLDEFGLRNGTEPRYEDAIRFFIHAASGSRSEAIDRGHKALAQLPEDERLLRFRVQCVLSGLDEKYPPPSVLLSPMLALADGVKAPLQLGMAGTYAAVLQEKTRNHPYFNIQQDVVSPANVTNATEAAAFAACIKSAIVAVHNLPPVLLSR